VQIVIVIVLVAFKRQRFKSWRAELEERIQRAKYEFEKACWLSNGRRMFKYLY
jgi:hypothetical protein